MLYWSIMSPALLEALCCVALPTFAGVGMVLFLYYRSEALSEDDVS